jgi:hypothetical protein
VALTERYKEEEETAAEDTELAENEEASEEPAE